MMREADDDDPYAVRQPLEILALLEGLFSRHTLIRLDVPGQQVAIVSTLLQVDRRAGIIILDNASDPQLDAQLLDAPLVHAQGTLDGVTIEFSGPLTAALHEGRPALSMVRPPWLRRIQRREDFRIGVPAGSAASCHIPVPGLPGGETCLPLINISAGGVHLADARGQFAQVVAGRVFDDCRLDLPGTGTVAVRLQLVRNPQRGGAPHTAAFRFVGLPVSHQVTIQQFIGALERAEAARRWGIL